MSYNMKTEDTKLNTLLTTLERLSNVLTLLVESNRIETARGTHQYKIDGASDATGEAIACVSKSITLLLKEESGITE